MLYNANTATLLESLEAGGHGYTGVMANFHPRLYRWLTRHWKDHPQEAHEVQAVLTMCALIELKKYRHYSDWRLVNERVYAYHSQ